MHDLGRMQFTFLCKLRLGSGKLKSQRVQYWFSLMVSIMMLYTPITIGETGGFGIGTPTRGYQINLPDVKKYRAQRNQRMQQAYSIPTNVTGKSEPTTLAQADIDTDADAEQVITNGRQKWNLKNVDIRTVISRVSLETGKNFVIDPRVQGKVTLVSQQELNPDELYKVFLAMLQVNGFSAVETQGVIRIIREQDIRSLAGPVVDFPQTRYADENVIKVIHVEHVPVKEMLATLKPLVPKTAHISVYGPSNDVIVADRAENVSVINKIIDQLDKPWTEGAEVIKLRHASPTEVVNILEGLRGGSARNNNDSPISLAADERTNSIIMSGPPSRRLQIRAMIARLDVESAYEGNIHVVYLKYTRASDLAPILANIIQSYETQAAAERSRSQLNTARSGGVRSNDGFGAFNRGGSAGNLGSGTGTGSSLSQLEQQGSQFFNQDDREKSGGVGSVQWEETTNAVIIKANPSLMKVLRSVIAKLDIRRPQVLVEAIIAEVDVDQVKSLGVEWNTNGDARVATRFPNGALTSIVGPLGGDGLSTGSSDSAISALPGVGLSLGFFHHDNLRALVRAIAGDTRNNVLATPNLITLDNEIANIKVGEKVPFLTGTTTNESGTSTAVNREEVGLSLTIRPQITQSGAIKMQINHVLSNVIDGSSSTNPGGNPTTSERIITTNVVVDNGETLVLGGLIRSDWIKTNDRVPVFGDIPVVGKLFRSDEKRSIKRNLMVFIRPIILRDKNDNIEVTTGKYNHIRQLQLESHRDVPRYDESPALEQLDAPKQLPPPFQYAHARYK